MSRWSDGWRNCRNSCRDDRGNSCRNNRRRRNWSFRYDWVRVVVRRRWIRSVPGFIKRRHERCCRGRLAWSRGVARIDQEIDRAVHPVAVRARKAVVVGADGRGQKSFVGLVGNLIPQIDVEVSVSFATTSVAARIEVSERVEFGFRRVGGHVNCQPAPRINRGRPRRMSVVLIGILRGRIRPATRKESKKQSCIKS